MEPKLSDTTDLDVVDILREFTARWRRALSVCLIFLLISLALYATQPRLYDSQSKIYLGPARQYTPEQVKAIVLSDSVLEPIVLKHFGSKLSLTEFKENNLEVNAGQQSPYLTLRVKSTNPTEAYEINGEMSDSIISKLNEKQHFTEKNLIESYNLSVSSREQDYQKQVDDLNKQIASKKDYVSGLAREREFIQSLILDLSKSKQSQSSGLISQLISLKITNMSYDTKLMEEEGNIQTLESNLQSLKNTTYIQSERDRLALEKQLLNIEMASILEKAEIPEELYSPRMTNYVFISLALSILSSFFWVFWDMERNPKSK